ncbi:MAG: ThiF family adenylyltransferase, partial [Actinomycetota bacterium]|nr:ThiF family adenylyltransferase [Actinomycetota bacterium]
MRPLLNPGLRRLWRDLDTVQLGVDPGRAVVLTGLDDAAGGLLDLLDGSRDRPAVLEAAAATGVAAATAERVLDLLAAAGALLPGPPADGLRAAARADRDRLGPDISSWSLDQPPRPAEVLLRRQQGRVVVVGAGRVGAPLAATLAAAGVGRVAVSDEEDASLADCAVGGLCAADVGAARETGARAAVRQAAPGVDNRPWRPGEPLD